MTPIELIAERCGKEVTEDTELDALGVDSLELLDIMVDLDVPAEYIGYLTTVKDLLEVAKA